MQAGTFVRAALGAAALATWIGCGGGGSSGGGGGASSQAVQPGGGSAAQMAPTRQSGAQVIDREGEGFLTLKDGRRVVHVKGSQYERGYQYGALVGDQVEGIVSRLPALATSQGVPGFAVSIGTLAGAALFEPYFPSDVKTMMRGVIDGNRARRPSSFLTLDDLIFVNSLVEIGAIYGRDIINCSTIAAWGRHTVDGKMFQTRCIDLFIGSGLEDYTLVAMEKGTGKVPFANLGWSGMIGSMSGMNAHGVAIGQVWAFSEDRGLGEPWGVTTRRILENAINAGDAVQIFQQVMYRTYGSNFVFGDKGDGRGGAPKAYAVESSQRYLAVFADNDPLEDQAIVQTANGPESYAVKAPEIVLRGDVTLDPRLRARQTASAGPTGDPRGAGAYRNRYKGQMDSFLAHTQAGAVPADAQTLIALTKDVAMRNSSLQCVIYANSDLEVWVADAVSLGGGPGSGLDAFTQPYIHHDFNFYLPTIKATLDAPSYVGGATQRITLEWSTLGCDRDLELELRIEGTGYVFTYPQQASRIPLRFREGMSPETRTLELEVPWLGNGSYQLVARLFERGSNDLVDVSIAPFTLVQ